jgi:acetyl-CoA synthetase
LNQKAIQGWGTRLRELATHGEIKGDTTTLEDFTVIAKLREAEEG